MKICFITSGNNIFFDKVAEYFVSKGHEIHAIILTPPMQEMKGVTYHFFGDQSKNAKRPFKQLFFYIRAKKFVKLILKPEIVSAFYITQCGWLGAFINQTPFILHVMGSDLLVATKINPIKKPLNNWAIRKAKLIISEANLIKNITSKIRKSEKNNEVIQFGVRTDLFRPGLDTTDLKQKLNINDEIVIISPRNNDPIYNQDIVIRAFANAAKSYPKMLLLIKAQNDDYKDKLEAIARSEKILNKIRFYGFVPFEDLPIYYNLARIMISVPSSDSVPASLLEAMACGVKPIVSNINAVKEWITNNKNGIVVENRNIESLSKAILFYTNDKNNRFGFLSDNIKVVKEKADYNKCMSKIEEVYLNSIRP